MALIRWIAEFLWLNLMLILGLAFVLGGVWGGAYAWRMTTDSFTVASLITAALCVALGLLLIYVYAQQE